MSEPTRSPDAAYVSGKCSQAVQTRPGFVAPCGLEAGHEGAHLPIQVSGAASVDEPVPTENLQARVQEARRLWGEGDESALIAYLLNVPVEKVLSVRP